MAFDLVVAYRVYPGVSKVPVRFADDKLKLAEVCLASFRDALAGLRVKVYALLDGCPPEYEVMFRRYFAPDEVEVVPLNGAGNLATFGLQLDLLTRQNEAELVYFAEDDYFYTPGAIHSMVEFVRANPDAGFVSPYDHLDSYGGVMERHPAQVRVQSGRHWRTAPSTCLTFLTSRAVLRDTEQVFRTYCAGNHDCSLWLALTKGVVAHPTLIPGLLREQRWMARLAARAVLAAPVQVLFGRRYSLWVPIPSVATHMDAPYLAPAVDWPALIDDAAQRIGIAAAPSAADRTPGD